MKAQDLGQAQNEEVLDNENVAEKGTLMRTQTQASALGQEQQGPERDGINYNFVTCTYLILKEQGRLWKWGLVLFVATLAGGVLTEVHS